MTVASTSTTIAQTSTALFDAWVQEVYTNLVTNCGLTQMSALMDTAQMAVPCATAVPGGANTAAGYYNLIFNDALSKGAISLAALVALTAGTGYNGGASHTFAGVALSGGTGTGAIGTVVLGASGVVSSITVTTAGSGYLVGDQLFVTSANIVAAGGASGGGSSGFAFVGVLSSGSPVVLKVEFGSGVAAANPQMWVTLSSGWVSNGTLVGVAGTSMTTRVALFCGAAPGSTITPFTSRYIYNSTFGFCAAVFKIAGINGTTTQALGSLLVFRSNDTNGAATGNSVMVVSNNSAATGSQVSSAGFMQCAQYGSGVITAITPPLSGTNSNLWGSLNNTGMPFNLTSTLQSGVVSQSPVYYLGPSPSFSAYFGVALLAEAPVGNSFPIAIVGATPRTFLSIGLPFGGGGIVNISNLNLTALMLWE